MRRLELTFFNNLTLKEKRGSYAPFCGLDYSPMLSRRRMDRLRRMDAADE